MRTKKKKTTFHSTLTNHLHEVVFLFPHWPAKKSTDKWKTVHRKRWPKSVSSCFWATKFRFSLKTMCKRKKVKLLFSAKLQCAAQVVASTQWRVLSFVVFQTVWCTPIRSHSNSNWRCIAFLYFHIHFYLGQSMEANFSYDPWFTTSSKSQPSHLRCYEWVAMLWKYNPKRWLHSRHILHPLHTVQVEVRYREKKNIAKSKGVKTIFILIYFFRSCKPLFCRSCFNWLWVP